METQTWRELDDETEKSVWERFDVQFSFRLKKDQVVPDDYHGFAEPSPSVTYSFADAFFATRGGRRDWRLYDEITKDIHRKALAAFRHCVAQGQMMFALQWQSTCYKFWPHAAFESERWKDWKEWPVSVVPDGDTYIFLAEDFNFGTFGYSGDNTLCVFGQPLVEAFERDPPMTFEAIRRK